MKLGTQTNSLTNHLLSRGVIGQPEPTVGMGATVLCWTDRHAATITKVETIRGRVTLTVREDRATRTDRNGLSECQTYTFEPNPNGATYTFRQRKGGMWESVVFNEISKRWRKLDGAGLRIGERNEYRDPSF